MTYKPKILKPKMQSVFDRRKWRNEDVIFEMQRHKLDANYLNWVDLVKRKIDERLKGEVMNSVLLIGRLTKDVDLRTTKSGTSVAGFILAVDKGLSKQKRDEAEQAGRPTADFISCQAWGMTADLLSQYCGKGSKIAIEGRIQTGSYEDRETGKTIYTTDVVINRLEFLDSRSTSSQDNRVADDDFFEDDFTEVDDNGSIPF